MIIEIVYIALMLLILAILIVAIINLRQAERENDIENEKELKRIDEIFGSDRMNK